MLGSRVGVWRFSECSCCVIGPVETIRGSYTSYSKLLQRKLNKQLGCETDTLNKT